MKLNPIFILVLIMFVSCAETREDLVESRVYVWNNLDKAEKDGIATRLITAGSSPHFADFEIKSLTFQTDSVPRTFQDDYENLIIIKQGRMLFEADSIKTLLSSKSVALIMPGQQYAIYSNEPVVYYLLRYKSNKPMDLERGMRSGGTMVFNRDSLGVKFSSKGGSTKYFDRPTAMCERYEMHTTTLNKFGPSHEGHTHEETEIILVISGKTKMIIGEQEYNGETGDLYLMTSGIYHQVSNDSDEPCEYFAFKWK
ncbi:cupin domain-containing protein [Marinoscillum sp. MHG1-6]|uniref:cupin domain-containing protein n=1 Tax=Marinoscillum sp. MHG1-6 TaxID=2959627 RepID=UPI002157AE3B|nr:cupin domain-containing protein [Marinoscillum sp. MHG1-6]